MSTPPATDPSSSGDPDWWKDGVVYQIYPRSFADSNGDGIGDLAGITEHLWHLAGEPGSLGIDAIWLSPIYPSPDFDFGYDVADYVSVDRRYGTLAEFERFVAAAHARGIKVILDLVLNHSSHRHAWFKASRSSRSGPFADWYIWRDSPGLTRTGRRRRPNNWRSFFGGPAWTWDETRGQFYLHTFLPQQPDLNWRNPEVRSALLGAVQTWLDRGVDGFRLDVFNTFFKDAAFQSNPRRPGVRGGWGGQDHIYDRNQPELSEALRELRAVVDGQFGGMTVGELFDGSVEEAAVYTEPRHLTFDWALIGLPWSAAAFAAAIRRREAVFGPDRWPANVLSNHDQPRHASRYDADPPDGGSLGDARAKVLACLLITLRGTPFMYYGEELAQRSLDIPNEFALDPPARRATAQAPWWNRDQARGPMAWRPGPGGGFTTGHPWLPLPPDVDRRNVETQAGASDSVLSVYRSVLRLRRELEPLRHGTQELLDAGDADVLAYRREAEGRSAIVALNFAARPATVELPEAGSAGGWRVALSTHDRVHGSELAGSVTLAPLEAFIAYD
ncbi:MAG: alpha-amylase family glycosyl hydrolase [Chloroflexota bacterium]